MLEQGDIVKELDDELSGSLIRLSFKTRDSIHVAVETELKNRAKRRRSLGMDTEISSSEIQVEAPMMRTSIFISDDNEEYKYIASQVLTNLGCATKQGSFDKGLLDGHLRKYKYSAALSDLHVATTNDSKVTTVSGHLTMCMPAHHHSASIDGINTNDTGILFSGKIVLIVDDSSTCRKQISKKLNSLGFEDEFAVNGQDALDKINKEPKKFCAIILDLLMPVMDGYAALKACREDLKLKVPIFVVTGQAEDLDVVERVKGLGGPSTLILKKPAEVSDLTAAFIKTGLISPYSP